MMRTARGLGASGLDLRAPSGSRGIRVVVHRNRVFIVPSSATSEECRVGGEGGLGLSISLVKDAKVVSCGGSEAGRVEPVF